ncbi:MAG: EamA family transporter [Planctomycetes bacterium]|nr:EamA family transporter [Planctomycetota bacterium]
MNEPADEIPHLTPPSPLAIACAFGIVYFSWGTTYMATSIAMKEEHMPPGLFGGVRLCLAGTILLVYQACRGESLRLGGGDYLRLLLVSWFLFLGANYLINVGQQKEPSGVAAILIATTPLWMGLFAMFFPSGERLSWRGWLGLLIGFAGIVLTKLDDGPNLLQNYHALFILASAAAWAMGSLVSRHMALKISHLTSAGFQMIFGGLSQITLATILGEWNDLPGLTGKAIAAFCYVLVFGSLLGFVAFNWLLGHISVAKVGTYAYVNPVVAVFIGWCCGETPLDVWIAAGIAVILVGVYLVRADRTPSGEIDVEPE